MDTYAMKLLLKSTLAAAAAALLAIPAHAQTVNAVTGTTTSVTSIDESINSNQMGGMKVTAVFAGGGTFSGFWSDLDGAGAGTNWGVNLFNGQTRMIQVSMSGPLDTYPNDWTVNLYTGTDLVSLLFEGGAAYGGVMFDRSTGFAGGSIGTPGSDVGNDYDMSSAWSGVTATYSNAIGLGAATPVGDLYQQVSVNFSNATYCNALFNCFFQGGPDGDVPDSGNSPFAFAMDTDKGTFAVSTVPEPSTYALMGAGLLGVFGVARRRRTNA